MQAGPAAPERAASAACRARTGPRAAASGTTTRSIANDGVIKLHVNGKEVSGVSKCKPRKGYLALESPRGRSATSGTSRSRNCRARTRSRRRSRRWPRGTSACSTASTWTGGRLVSAAGLSMKARGRPAGETAGRRARTNSGQRRRPIRLRASLIFDWKVPAKATTSPSAQIVGWRCARTT